MGGFIRHNTILGKAFTSLAKQLLNKSSGPGELLLNRATGERQLLQKRTYNPFRNEQPPSDPHRQVEFLRDLNKRGDAEAVIQQFEGGRIVSTEATLGEYVRALASVDKLNGSSLLRTLQRGVQNSMASNGGAATYAASSSGRTAEMESVSNVLRKLTGGANGAASELGSSKNPIFTMQAEPTLKSQLWRTVRTLAIMFVVISGLGAFLEEKGLGKGLIQQPDMRPQIDGKTKFKDVKGVDEAKAELEEIVHYLRDPQKFTTLGGKLPKGILLVGPPGTGKTMLARAIAGEAGVPFFYCSGSEFEEMFVGVGARRVRDLFAAAKKTAPCIIFIDEIDAIGGSRNSRDQQYMKMTLNQLLVELDGFKPSEGVIVVAATNFPESLDKALVRPGRFDRHVAVPNPDIEGRRQILESHFQTVPRFQDVDLSVIARGTPGFSGADLANLVNVAALKAAKDGQQAVSHADLEHAKDRIIMGAERKSAVISEKNRKLTAYHEGGHALVALFTEGAHPIHKATIVPRGMALGMVTQLPEEADEHSVTMRQLLAKLDVAMGGRVAEELIFGESDVTTGASSDLEQATRLARAMVTKYGMSEALGKVAINYEDNGRSVSSETRNLVETEVKRILNLAYGRAQNILRKHEAELHTLAQALVDKETLTGAQIRDLLKTYPQAAKKASENVQLALKEGVPKSTIA